MIKNVVFDMGQVLIHFCPELYIERLGVNEEDSKLLLREVFRRVEWVQLDHGTISEEEFEAFWDNLDEIRKREL